MKSITLKEIEDLVLKIKQQAGQKKVESQQVSILMDGVGMGLDTLIQELHKDLVKKEHKDVAESDKPSKSKNKKS